MTFPNAAKGISKIFTAEILSLIASVAFGIAYVLAIVFASADNAQNEVGAIASGSAFLIMGVGAAVVAIISLIFQLVGVIQTARDEAFFRGVIYLTIISIVFSCIAQAFISSNTLVYNICNSISTVTDFIASLFVILGIGNMAAILGNTEVIEKCGSLFKVILWIGIVTLIARFFSLFLPTVAAQAIVITLAILAMILGVAQLIIYLSLLNKAKKMLAEK